MPEDDRAEHDFFGQLGSFRLDHQDGVLGSRNDQVQLRSRSVLLARVQQVLAVLVANARRADRTLERHARQRQRRRAAQQRRNVGIDIRIQRDDRGHDLDVVVEAVREQRTHRTIDQARGQRFFFSGPAFALEEAAGDAARGIGLLDVIDRQREEITARGGGLLSNGRTQNDGVTHRGDDGAIGLPGNFARLQGDGMRSKLKRSLDRTHA